MLRILLSISSMLAACTPSPQKAVMPSSNHVLGTTVQGSSEPSSDRNVSAAPDSGGRGVGNPAPAVMRPTPEPEAMAKTSAPGQLADSPAEARGRLILSTAFVRVGPGGHLTVELRNGRVLALRDVVMRPREYCGMQVAGDTAPTQYCGGYAEVAAARPGGAQAVSDAVEPAQAPPKAK